MRQIYLLFALLNSPVVLAGENNSFKKYPWHDEALEDIYGTLIALALFTVFTLWIAFLGNKKWRDARRDALLERKNCRRLMAACTIKLGGLKKITADASMRSEWKDYFEVSLTEIDNQYRKTVLEFETVKKSIPGNSVDLKLCEYIRIKKSLQEVSTEFKRMLRTLENMESTFTNALQFIKRNS